MPRAARLSRYTNMTRLSVHLRRSRRRHSRIGFTLIEVMISVAIVLVLMLGINYVFSTSAKTISIGMAATGVNREIRGARKVFEKDFANAVSAEEMPALIIHNEIVYAWKDKQDKLTDADNDPTTYDVDGEPGDEIDMSPNTDATGLDPSKWSPTTPAPYGNLPGVLNSRRHRVDRISFFVRNSNDPYKRQTGNSATYVSTITSPEAWIQYGLLRLADNNGVTYWKPGARGDQNAGAYPDEAGNQNNFFTTQWTLGRKVMLLVGDPSSLPPESTFIPTTGAAASFFGLNFGAPAQRKTTTQTLPYNRETPPYATATPWRPEESRIDLVSVTPLGAATGGSPMQLMRARVALAGANPFWGDSDPTTTTPSTNRDKRTYTDPPQAGFPLSLNYLSWAKAFVNKSNFATSPADQTRETALTTPIFLRGVQQFIVEFAGDFYDQGTALEPEPLGTIDYVPNAVTGDQIRWYGMPRETDGVPGIGVKDTRPLLPAANAPLKRDNSASTPRFDTGKGLTMEKARLTLTSPYWWAWGPTDPTPANVPTAAGPGGVPAAVAGAPYNIRPSLIRITMELMDSNGRLADGQRIELVFRLKTPTF
jgi:prepilin-type N-terminal cleavage/methylation domain-containing protein